MEKQPLVSFGAFQKNYIDASAKLITGRTGEKLAKMYLEYQGYVIVSQNWRNGRYGEIDLIALTSKCIVAVEVKTRRGVGYGHPLESITRSKLCRIRSAFSCWLRENRRYYPDRDIRIDGLGILLLPLHLPRFDHRIGLM